MMNSHVRKLARRYFVRLRKYLAEEQEAVLEQAYELGRVAIARGLGVLDMVRIHQQALETLVWPARREDHGTALRLAETFFLESLSAFEATHRGFRETNIRLRQLIATLEKRNLDLARVNRTLGREIRQRRRTEKALRESQEHFRELFQEARRMENDLRSLSHQIVNAQEEERKHISRELHDEVGQALTAISVTLATLKASGDGRDRNFSRQLTDAQRLLQDTMEVVHNFARELRPAMLDELGLLPALRSYLRGLSERTGLHIQFHGNALAEQLSGEQKMAMFRVAQESLTNVVKHAGASQVILAVRKVGDSIGLDVKDNGKSFQLGPDHSGPAKRRLGLLGMQERIRLVNGRFTIRAEPGHGTTILVRIPLRLKNPPQASSRRSRQSRNGEGERLVPRLKRPVREP